MPSEMRKRDLVVADTREQVARISALARRVRVASRDVSDGVVRRAGERIGVGDSIMTHRNSTDHDVANRETWTVLETDPAGMTVAGAAGRRRLPAEYVLKDVELAYATTAYGAQGVTVETSHVLAGESAGGASTYVGMTRGRERNVAHLVADSVDEARRHWIAGVRARPGRPRPGARRSSGRGRHRTERANARCPMRRRSRPRGPQPDFRPRFPATDPGPGIGF